MKGKMVMIRRIPDSLKKELKKMCAELDVTMNELLISLIAKCVEVHRRKGKAS